MLRNILVCMDNSPSGEAALELAVEITREHRANLVGLAVVDKPGICAGAAMGIGGSSFKRDRDKKLLALAYDSAAQGLATFARQCSLHGVSSHGLQVVGRPAESILGEMPRFDLTVMGRDANFSSSSHRSDSGVRDTILRHAEKPVLLVPDTPVDGPLKLGKTVLVAYDGGAIAQHALEGFLASGLAKTCEVHVATAGDDGERAGDIAETALARLRSAGMKAYSHTLVSCLPTREALVKLGSDLGAGLMVMGAFARSRLSELLHGSGTRFILDHAPGAICLQH